MTTINPAVSIMEDKENTGILSEISKSQSNKKQSAKDVELDGLKDLMAKVQIGGGDQECKSEEVTIAKQKYPASMDLNEPLCIESKNRFVLFPIANQQVLDPLFIAN